MLGFMERRLLTYGRCGVALAVLLFVAAPVSGQVQTTEQVLDRVRSKLAHVETLYADFSQTFSSRYIEETESLEGTVLLKGDKYRVETPTQVFVTDGRVTWVYNASEDQLLISDYVEDETTFSLNAFLFGFEKRYRVVDMTTDTRERDVYVINLRAVDPAAFFPTATMYVQRADYDIVTLQVTDVNETLITFKLRNVVYNRPISEDRFRYDPAGSTEVVDLRG